MSASFRDELKKKLNAHERESAIYSFDVLGDMALIEIPHVLSKKKQLIARTLLDTHPRIQKVYEKVGEHEGKYRIEKIAWLAGEKNSESVYKEWDCVFHVDPGKVFFNPRLSTERQRVASFVRKGQRAVVFFGGVGIYAIQMAKHCSPAHVLTLEWNPSAKKWVEENIRRNKVGNIVHAQMGDVRKIKPRATFDHVIMPAPENAVEYLPYAIKWLSKKGGLIHCYTFVSNLHPEKEAKEKIQHVLGKTTPYKIVFVHKVQDFSSSKWQVCVGIRVKGALFKKEVKPRKMGKR